MAYVMTFDSLLVDMRRYLERGFTEATDPIVFEQLPRLVNMAERRIAHEFKLQGFLRVVTTPLTPGLSTYRKPDRWRNTVSMRVNGTPVFARGYEYIRSYWPDETQTDTPEFYADYDYQHWVFAPTPAAGFVLECIYHEMPALLDAENQTNWLTEYAPNLLLYGALLEAAPFLKDDERIPVWQNSYSQAAQALGAEDTSKIIDRAAARTSP